VKTMQRKVMILATFCWFSLLPGCSQQQQPSQPAAQQPAALPASKSAEQPPDVIVIRGVLVNKDGSVASGKKVVAYPLDKKGTPLIVQVEKESDKPGFVSLNVWNPKSESDSEGGFTISMPRVSRIGKEPVVEIAFGLNEPPGGWASFTVSEIQYSTGDKKVERAYANEAKGLALLRKANQIVRVKIEGANEVDVGKILVE
jgi:hypothetical protein